MARSITKISKSVIKGANYVSAYVFLVAMLVLMISDVFMRYIIGAPFSWSNEITTYLMIVLSFSSFSIAFAKDIHPRVTLLFDRLHHKFRNVLWVVISLLTTFYVGFIAYAVFVLAFFSLERRTVSPTSEVMLYPWQMMTAVALVILSIVVVMFTAKRGAIALGLLDEKSSERGLIQLETEAEREKRES